MQTLINARQRPIITPWLCPSLHPFPQLAFKFALLTALALCQLFDGLAAGASAGGLVCMRVHHTPGNFAPPAVSSVLR